MDSVNRKVFYKNLELTFELLVTRFNDLSSTFKYSTQDIDNFGCKLVVEIDPKSGVNDRYVAIHFGYVKTESYQRRSRTPLKYLRFSAGIVDRKGNVVSNKQSSMVAMTSYTLMKHWYHFIERKHLFNHESGLLVANNLKVFCHFEVCDKKKPIFSDSNSMANTFEKCYTTLLKDNELSDFTIVVNDREFPVHRSILAARSPVFRAMITTDMKEKKQSRVVLHDIDEEVAEQLIYYIYTGTAPRIKELAQKLSIVAEFYDIPDLKLFCAQTMFSHLTEDNVLEALRFGETYAIHELVANAIDFIGENHEKVRSKVISET